jgi:cysteine-rich repeat protein
VADSTGCTGTELCSDGADNDGDSAVDCADTDCTASCENSCAAPTPLANGAAVSGRILEQQSSNRSSCAPDGPSGQVVYAYTPALTGIAQLFLDGASAGLVMSLRNSCEDESSERECAVRSENVVGALLKVSVTSGETLFVVVENADRSVQSTFQLVASAHEVVCGDGYIDLDEECDDGNFVDDDGCNNDCEFLSDEQEPNSSIENADPFVAPEFFGSIRSSADLDIVSIVVGAGQTLVAETYDLGDGACNGLELDNWLDVLTASGEVLASDDDAGIGYCAALVSGPLDAGIYYVRVRASGTTESFSYRLGITLQN